MSFAGIVLGAGVLFSAYSSQQAGKQGEAISQQEATFQREKAALEEQRFRFQIPRALGTQKAVLAQSGRDFSTGIGLDLIAESAGELELDALITRFGGEVKATSAISEGSLLAQRGKNQAISTLLTGGFNVASHFA